MLELEDWEKRHLRVCKIVAPEAINEDESGQILGWDCGYYSIALFDWLDAALDLFDMADGEDLEDLLKIQSRINARNRPEVYGKQQDPGGRLLEVYESVCQVLRRLKREDLGEKQAGQEILAVLNPHVMAVRTEGLKRSPSRYIEGLPQGRACGRPGKASTREWLVWSKDWQEDIQRIISEDTFQVILSCDGPAKATKNLLKSLTGSSITSISNELALARKNQRKKKLK